MSPSLSASSEAALEVNDFSDDDEAVYELQDAYEAQRRAKDGVRKSYRSYKESRKKVKEIRKSRQPYLPVVAVPPDDPGLPSSTTAQQGTVKPTFRYDRKARGRSQHGQQLSDGVCLHGH